MQKQLPKYKINEMRAKSQNILDNCDCIISINRVKPQTGDPTKILISRNIYK